MKGNYYILEDYEPKLADPVKWALWFSYADRQVSVTETKDGVRISTVFLGLNHQWGDGPPLLFETLVFGGIMGGEMWRCSTWSQALAQHDRVVALVTLNEDDKPKELA